MTTSAALVSPAKVFARSTGEAAWLGPKQAAALGHLRGAAGVRVLLGPPSSGKSTLLRLFARQAKDTVLLPINGPKSSAHSVLSTLLTAAELGLWTLSETEQRNLLTVFVEQRRSQGNRIAICVDNISTFSDDAWDEIERLTQQQVAGRPTVELIVAGTQQEASHAPLHRVLKASRPFGVEAVHSLSAPDGPDLESYIRWRLARFGIRSTFTPEACAAIAAKSRGRFNSVNLICQVLLWNVSLERPESVDAEAVDIAVSKLAALKDPELRSSTQKLRRLELHEAGGTSGKSGRLVVSANGENECELPLAESIVIGRGPDSDLRLESRFVSRHHAAITRTRDGGYFIADLQSTNGVLVNGRFVSRSVLGDGDIIDLCEYQIRVELIGVTSVERKLDSSADVDDADTDIMPAPDLKRSRLAPGR